MHAPPPPPEQKAAEAAAAAKRGLGKNTRTNEGRKSGTGIERARGKLRHSFDICCCGCSFAHVANGGDRYGTVRYHRPRSRGRSHISPFWTLFYPGRFSVVPVLHCQLTLFKAISDISCFWTLTSQRAVRAFLDVGWAKRGRKRATLGIIRGSQQALFAAPFLSLSLSLSFRQFT